MLYRMDQKEVLHTAQRRTSILQIGLAAAAAAAAVAAAGGHSRLLGVCRLLSSDRLAWICPRPAGKPIVPKGGFTRLLQPLELQPHSVRKLCRVLLQHLPQLMATLCVQVCQRDACRPKLGLLREWVV